MRKGLNIPQRAVFFWGACPLGDMQNVKVDKGGKYAWEFYSR